MISIQTLRRLYFTLAMLVSAYVTGHMLINDDNMNDIGTQRVFLMRAIFCMVWVVCTFWYVKDIYLKPISTKENPYRMSIIRRYIIYTIFTCISILVTNSESIKEVLSAVTLFLCPCLIFLGSYVYTRRFGEQRNTMLLVILLMGVCIYTYVSQYNLYNVLDVRGHFGTAYYPLYLLPIMFASNKKWLRYVTLLVVAIVIISSLKRGGLVALVLGISAYIMVEQYMKKKNTFVFRTTVLLIIVLVLCYIGILYFGDTLIERFLNEDDTTGSGRTEIWASLFTHMNAQDLSSWLIGNGHLATMRDSVYNRSAHNDFLEVIYNYGIPSFIAYMSFIIAILQYTLRAIRQGSKYASSIAMLFTIYMVLSMVSIIILLHTATLVLLGLGVLIGWNEYELHQPNMLENEQTTSA